MSKLLGDMIADAAAALGFGPPCDKCKKRKAKLNAMHARLKASAPYRRRGGK